MKSTKELINQIKSSSNLCFLKDKDFKCPQIHYYLSDLLREYGISGMEFIKKLNLDRSYGYQILNGNRRPSREILIQAAMLLGLNLEETQRLLKIGKREVLYPRVKRDAIAIYSLEKGLCLEEYWELLDAYEES